jgi:hypothetical protein
LPTSACPTRTPRRASGPTTIPAFCPYFAGSYATLFGEQVLAEKRHNLRHRIVGRIRVPGHMADATSTAVLRVIAPPRENPMIPVRWGSIADCFRRISLSRAFAYEPLNCQGGEAPSTEDMWNLKWAPHQLREHFGTEMANPGKSLEKP